MKEKLRLVLLFFFALLPVLIGMAVWIYGRVTNNKKLRHNGFMMMMLAILLIVILVFSVGVVIFFLYLNSK